MAASRREIRADVLRKPPVEKPIEKKEDRKITYKLTRGKDRVKLGKSQDRLNFKRTAEIMGPEWKLRVVNDRQDKIMQALERGYVFVQGDDTGGVILVDERSQMGASIQKHVGTDEKGESITGYLMAIKREHYEEDQAAKQAAIDRKEEAMFRPQVHEGQYGTVTRAVEMPEV